MIVRIMGENSEKVKRLILETIPKIRFETCSCRGT